MATATPSARLARAIIKLSYKSRGEGVNDRRRSNGSSVSPTNSSLGDWDWRPRLPSLDLPVLLVWGEADRGPPELEQEWLSGLPRGQMLSVPGAGHWPFCENPEAFFPAVERFLGR